MRRRRRFCHSKASPTNPRHHLGDCIDDFLHADESEPLLRVWRVFRAAGVAMGIAARDDTRGGGGQRSARDRRIVSERQTALTEGEQLCGLPLVRRSECPGKKKGGKARIIRHQSAAPPTWTDRHFNPKMNADMHSHSPQKHIYLS